MAYIWTPPAGQLLSYRDDGNGFSESVTVEGEETTVTDPDTGEETTEKEPDPNQFTVSGLDSSITFSFLNNTWTVEATKEEAAGIFPVEITYLQTRYKESMQTVSSWNDLPADAEEVIGLETVASSPFTTTFDVTASVDGDPLTEETKTYSIEVIHVYTSSKDRLQLEISLRS